MNLINIFPPEIVAYTCKKKVWNKFFCHTSVMVYEMSHLFDLQISWLLNICGSWYLHLKTLYYFLFWWNKSGFCSENECGALAPVNNEVCCWNDGNFYKKINKNKWISFIFLLKSNLRRTVDDFFLLLTIKLAIKYYVYSFVNMKFLTTYLFLVD